MPVQLTETAAREINSIIKQQELDAEKIRLRVGVKGGGCSGFSYLLDLTESQKESDEEWAFTYHEPGGNGSSNGEFTIRLICDPKSYLYLEGTTVDFKDELMGRGFVFNNPKATATCGCGSSFSA